MTRFSFIESCQRLSIDPKTLRQWLAQAQISLHPHPKDARIKCLTGEQVQVLARMHGRVLSEAVSASPKPEEAPSGMSPTALSEAALRARLGQLEAQVAALQTQLTDLALQLLRERQYHTEQQMLARPVHQAKTDEDLFVSQAGSMLCEPFQPAPPPLVCHPTEKRTPLVPLIEYGAGGRYVLICPKQGELTITPDSPEWFAWLASLSSFRFVGRSGRFSARRRYNRRPNRSWYAQRRIHQKNYSKYIGVSEHITTERMEQVAASFQVYLQ
jgi:hypothetical protein